jgi:very-short-patch-repair endonuclease
MCGFPVQPSLDERVAALAAVQYGVVTRAQLVGAGASERQIEYRCRLGRLIRLYRGVYAVGHAVLRTEGRWLAAVLACGPGAMLSHTAAAALWGMRPVPAGRIHVTTCRGGRTAPRGIVLHTTTRPEATTCRGIPVTTPMRTLADLATIVTAPVLARALEAAETLRLLDTSRLRPGSRGLPALRAQFAHAETVTRSDFEALFLDLCDRHGIPRPLTNQRVGPYEVDALWPDRRLIVECDSYDHHHTRRAFQTDRRRDADLLARGYRTMRFTYDHVTRREAWVAHTLRAAYAASGSGSS